MADEERYMRIALEEARAAADAGEVPVGAVITLGDEVIGRGRNRTIERNDPTAHAEILAIRDACARLGEQRLVGATMFVTLEPCPMCAGAIVHARLARLIFGAHDAKGGGVVSLYAIPLEGALNHTVATVGGLLDLEGAALLQSFFHSRRSDTTGSPTTA